MRERTFTLVIDQQRLDTLMLAEAERNPRATARYPRPPEFWQAFVPEWITLEFEGDLVRLSVTGHNAHRDALDRFVATVAVLNGAVVDRAEVAA
jgi:hypothetical protein